MCRLQMLSTWTSLNFVSFGKRFILAELNYVQRYYTHFPTRIWQIQSSDRKKKYSYMYFRNLALSWIQSKFWMTTWWLFTFAMCIYLYTLFLPCLLQLSKQTVLFFLNVTYRLCGKELIKWLVLVFLKTRVIRFLYWILTKQNKPRRESIK